MDRQLDIRDLEIRALLEITQAINSNLTEDDLYKIYRFTLLGDLKVKHLALFVRGEDWQCQVQFGTKTDWSKTQLPEFYQKMEDTVDFKESEFEGFQRAYPVYHKDDLLAVLFIGGLVEIENSIDSTFLRTLTNILIVAIENKKLARKQLEQEAYRKELEIAKQVQNFLFPKTLPHSDRLRIEAIYMPHHDVGGDYYDYIKLSEDEFAVCIADVSGKGVPAALLMSNFQASLRSLIRTTDDLSQVVKELNHATYSSSNGENFITFFIAVYNYKNSEMTYVNCGHNPPVILTDHSPKLLETGTTVLGMFDPLPFLEKDVIKIPAPFLFFAYTDGLTETFDSQGEQFGYDRIEKLLEVHREKPISELHTIIMTEIEYLVALLNSTI